MIRVVGIGPLHACYSDYNNLSLVPKDRLPLMLTIRLRARYDSRPEPILPAA